MIYIIQHIIAFIIGFLIGWAIWKIYLNHKLRLRYFYVTYYTTKRVGNECKIIYGSNTFITRDGLYLNKNEVVKMLSKSIDAEDSIVLLNIIEFKKHDYYRFTSN